MSGFLYTISLTIFCLKEHQLKTTHTTRLQLSRFTGYKWKYTSSTSTSFQVASGKVSLANIYTGRQSPPLAANCVCNKRQNYKNTTWQHSLETKTSTSCNLTKELKHKDGKERKRVRRRIKKDGKWNDKI